MTVDDLRNDVQQFLRVMAESLFELKRSVQVSDVLARHASKMLNIASTHLQNTTPRVTSMVDQATAHSRDTLAQMAAKSAAIEGQMRLIESVQIDAQQVLVLLDANRLMDAVTSWAGILERAQTLRKEL